MSELKNCPFCGCEMKQTASSAIHGNHSEQCYFWFIDHQSDFHFCSNAKHRDILHEAWNRRAAE